MLFGVTCKKKNVFFSITAQEDKICAVFPYCSKKPKILLVQVSPVVLSLCRSFKETMSSLRPEKKWVTKLSSAGLVYLHFGHQLIAQLLELPPSDPVTELIYDKVYENFVEEVDAIDNGINATDEEPR